MLTAKNWISCFFLIQIESKMELNPMEAVLFPIVAPTTNIVIYSVVRSVDSRSTWMANIVKFVCVQ